MKSDLIQLGYVRSYKEEMKRLKAVFINNKSLIVLNDSYFPYEMLHVLQQTLNGSTMILTSSKTRLPLDTV